MDDFSTEGSHIVLDVWDGDGERYNDVKFVLQALKEAAEATGATTLVNNFVKFEPHGLTAFWILSESHISCHLWESGYGAFDIFTCGQMNTDKAVEILLDKFKATKYSIQKIKRGVRYD